MPHETLWKTWSDRSMKISRSRRRLTDFDSRLTSCVIPRRKGRAARGLVGRGPLCPVSPPRCSRNFSSRLVPSAKGSPGLVLPEKASTLKQSLLVAWFVFYPHGSTRRLLNACTQTAPKEAKDTTRARRCASARDVPGLHQCVHSTQYQRIHS
jgi:hypothetical protein